MANGSGEPPSIESLAYDEALRAISQQQAVLESIYSRAGILLAATSLVTSFFGGEILRDGKPSWAVWLAILCFLISGGLSVAVLWPRAGWVFRRSPRKILNEFRKKSPTAGEQDVRVALAGYLEDHFEENETKLRNLFLCFAWAGVFLLGEVGAWLYAMACR